MLSTGFVDIGKAVRIMKAAQPVDEAMTEPCSPNIAPRRPMRRRKLPPIDPRRAPEGVAAGPLANAQPDAEATDAATDRDPGVGGELPAEAAMGSSAGSR